MTGAGVKGRILMSNSNAVTPFLMSLANIMFMEMFQKILQTFGENRKLQHAAYKHYIGVHYLEVNKYNLHSNVWTKA